MTRDDIKRVAAQFAANWYARMPEGRDQEALVVLLSPILQDTMTQVVQDERERTLGRFETLMKL